MAVSLVIFSIFLVVSGNSMYPNFLEGDLIIAYTENAGPQYAFENLRVGDIIVYEHNNKTIMHRIISVEKLLSFENENKIIFAQTKGDNNQISLGYYDFVTKDNYIAKLGKHYRNNTLIN